MLHYLRCFYLCLFFICGCGRIWGTATSQNALCFSSYPSQVLSDNPVGYWRLIETSGTTAYDIGTGGVNATYGINTILGQPPAIVGFGNFSAYLSNVATDLADVAVYTLAPQNTKTLTVEAWVKAFTTGSDIEIFASNGGLTKGFTFDINQVGLCGAGQFDIAKFGVTGTICAGGWPNDTNWHHTALVSDVTGMTVYVDGAIAGVNPDTHSYIACDGTCTLHIGNNGVTAFIEEVAIYTTPLTQPRIQAHYNAGLVCH